MARRFLATILALVAAGPGMAAPQGDIQPAADVLNAARAFVEHTLADQRGSFALQLGTLDPRLRLALCGSALQGFLPPGSRLEGNTSIGVRCTGAQGWTLYVPASIRLTRKVAVAKGYLPRGARLGPDNVAFEERDVTTEGRGFVAEAEAVFGKVLRQPLQDGRIIAPGQLTEPDLIRRGERVVIVSGTQGYEVRMEGQALMDGAKGEVIKVKNTRSKRVVEGTVSAPGVVTVVM